jgi:thermostable 8-oxoguanine DNA glycosylase
MIDPVNITNFKLSRAELEEMLLFWVCAAGKNAITASKSLDRLLTIIEGHSHPFAAIQAYGQSQLAQLLKSCGIGCFNNKAKTFWQLADSDLNLRKCSADDLERIHGIGRKTSRCFIMHSRRKARCAGLDVHILHYLNDQGYTVPKVTPSSHKEYSRVENIFLELADKSGQSTAEFDLSIWKKYSGRD